MYCKMCGKKIGDTDHFCQFCGTPTGNADPSAAPSETKEEIIFNPPYEDKSHMTEEEELKEYISENEIEEAQQEEVQKKEETDEPEPDKNPEFAWNVYEFPSEKKKTEDIEFNWNTEDFGQTEQTDVKEAAFEEELFQEIRDDSNRIKEQNIDRFFSFSRKNEEFQKLLDKEYEKFNMRSEPIVRSLEELPLTEAAEEPSAEVTIGEVAEVAAAPTEPQVKVIKESGIPEAVPLQEIHIEPDTQEEEPVTEPESPAEEPVTELAGEDLFEAEPETVVPEVLPEIEAVVPAAEPEPEAAKPRAEHISEMEQARAQYFGEELIRDNESIRKKLTAGDQEPEPEKESVPGQDTEPEPEQAKTVEDYIKEEKEAEDYIESPAEAPGYEEPEEDADNRAERVAAAYAAAAALEEAEDQTAVSPSDDFSVTIGEEDKEEDGKHKRSIGQIVLAVIAVILVIEIAILGIRYFAPESGAAKAIGNVQTGAFNTVLGWFDGGGDQTKDSGADKQDALPGDGDQTGQDGVQPDETQTDDQTKTPVADPNPMADKNALVSSQIGNNKNIAQVKANEALAWQQGKNYGLSDINNSKPITNNIWQAPETGDPIYYDKSVVGTVIAFDSQWIDYVNGSDKNVLGLMKKDSEAYRKSVNYSKVGKIKETFKLLEIGEIRQGANGFYIWVHEEIGATENGKTSDMKYNWIYYLEPVDGQMKIVNYYHF